MLEHLAGRNFLAEVVAEGNGRCPQCHQEEQLAKSVTRIIIN